MCKSASHGTGFCGGFFFLSFFPQPHWTSSTEGRGQIITLLPINVKIRMKISTLPYLSKTLTASTKQWKTVTIHYKKTNTLQFERRNIQIYDYIHPEVSEGERVGAGMQQKKKKI